MMVHWKAELAQSYIAHARVLRPVEADAIERAVRIQKVLRAIHSRISESTTT